MHTDIVNLARQFIAIPSVSENLPALNQIFDLVEREFAGYPVMVNRFVSNGKPSLVVTLGDTKTPDIFLNGHLDVVAGKSSAFQPVIRGDRLYGRGAYDMKASCAVMIQLMKDLSSRSLKKDRVGLMLVSDEEVGGADGSRFLLQQGYKPKELLVAGENSDFDIVYETKGVLWLKLIARGKASHGAYPWRGSNAIIRLSNSLSAFSRHHPIPGDEAWETTHVVTQISGGASINQVPDYAEASLDIRYIAEDLPAIIIDRLRSFLEEEVSIEVILHEEAHVLAANDPFLYLLRNIVNEVSGYTPKLLKRHAISDARFFTRVNVAACEFGLKGKYQHHDDEYVDLQSIGDYYEILKRLIVHCS